MTPSASDAQSEAGSERSDKTVDGEIPRGGPQTMIGRKLAKQNSDMILLLCGHPHQAHWLRCAYTPFEVGAFIEWAYIGSIEEVFDEFGPYIDNMSGNNDRMCALMHLHRFASDVEATELVEVVEEAISETTMSGIGEHIPDPTVIDCGDTLLLWTKSKLDAR
ncbi:Hypothetical protein D9617_14g077500 [Elsinoe fawcettii]|nr:Hypothetical protein D9617_14g077500 [Elsinoe fawcettii]